MRKYHLLIIGLFLLTGCQAARMPVGEELADAEVMAVEGRQGFKIKEHLRFGTFEAQQIKRSWTRGEDLEVLVYEGNRRFQQYNFVLQEGGADAWFVSCRAFLRKHTLDFGVEVDLKNQSELLCNLQSISDRNVNWELSLAETRERPLEGRLTKGTNSLAVKGTRKLAGGLPLDRTSGYEIFDGARTVAAVEVMNNGSVRLASETSEGQRSVLASTAAALLLLEDLREHLPEAIGMRDK